MVLVVCVVSAMVLVVRLGSAKVLVVCVGLGFDLANVRSRYKLLRASITWIEDFVALLVTVHAHNSCFVPLPVVGV